MTEGLGNTNLPTSLKRAYYITELQSFHSVVGIIIYFFLHCFTYKAEQKLSYRL